METIELFLIVSIIIVFYTYIGYGLVVYLLLLIKRAFFASKQVFDDEYQPKITIIIAAYNEQDFVRQKVANTNSLDYPSNKIQQIWITDGSTDNTAHLLQQYPHIMHLHQAERHGKIAAINRAMKFVHHSIVIFTDANTLLNKDAVKAIVAQFADSKTGCVSGEKRIQLQTTEAAAASGEGLYWKYESRLKQWDSELNSAVGAAGELFAVRTELFQSVEPDTLLDDFVISLRIAMKGYKIRYTPTAFATETASASVSEELKRKIRIAAGGIQSIIRLLPLLNIFKYRMLTFQYLSHRVLRWTIAPLLLPLVLICNFILIPSSPLYLILAILQVLFYAAAIGGWFLQTRKLKIKLLFVPYYFFMMNYAVYRGFLRFIRNTQSVNWERAKRG